MPAISITCPNCSFVNDITLDEGACCNTVTCTCCKQDISHDHDHNKEVAVVKLQPVGNGPPKY